MHHMDGMPMGAIPPPDGDSSDLSGSMTYMQLTTVAVFGVTFTLATLFLLLRLYTTIAIVKVVELDDPMPYGWGQHLWDISPEKLSVYYKFLVASDLTYIWTPTLTKLAILTLYHKVNPGPIFRICVYAIASLMTCYTVILTVFIAGPCNAVHLGNTSCLNSVTLAQSGLNIATDIAIIILPIPMIHSLKMPFKQKLALGGILALGSAVVVISLVRVAFVEMLPMVDDFTWHQAMAGICSVAELNVGVACNSLVRLKPFMRKHLPKLMGTRTALTSGPTRDFQSHASRSCVESGRVHRAADSQEGSIHVTKEFHVYEGETGTDSSTERIMSKYDEEADTDEGQHEGRDDNGRVPRIISATQVTPVRTATLEAMKMALPVKSMRESRSLQLVARGAAHTEKEEEGDEGSSIAHELSATTSLPKFRRFSCSDLEALSDRDRATMLRYKMYPFFNYTPRHHYFEYKWYDLELLRLLGAAPYRGCDAADFLELVSSPRHNEADDWSQKSLVLARRVHSVG
ncbi:hypothetical protein F4780DRAFT_776435 [Xylariomycetidae sp. FL0641]|nr:hypothetical protein F4780DRAFT_776435 [Xylariomycetidae sp. FL0641]